MDVSPFSHLALAPAEPLAWGPLLALLALAAALGLAGTGALERQRRALTPGRPGPPRLGQGGSRSARPVALTPAGRRERHLAGEPVGEPWPQPSSIQESAALVRAVARGLVLAAGALAGSVAAVVGLWDRVAPEDVEDYATITSASVTSRTSLTAFVQDPAGRRPRLAPARRRRPRARCGPPPSSPPPRSSPASRAHGHRRAEQPSTQRPARARRQGLDDPTPSDRLDHATGRSRLAPGRRAHRRVRGAATPSPPTTPTTTRTRSSRSRS